MDHEHNFEYFVTVSQELSLARTLDNVMRIVRRAARRLTEADGATFILREGDLCYYAEEDAIAPLWKGQRFPMDRCISGWVMLNRQPAVIEDIYADPRIPADAYRPTFVKSLLMVPIRTIAPLGAIGNYWSEQHQPSPQAVKLLRALADITAVAIENVQVYQELEQRVLRRTAELQLAVEDLEQALKEVKTLQGLIPICAWCKKIRDDEGFWQKLETYLCAHTEADFTHGICPECQQKLRGNRAGM